MLGRLALMLCAGIILLAPRLAMAEAMIFSPPPFDPAMVQKLINDYRRSRGLEPLELNARLTAAASAHCHDLARHDTISHSGSDGSQPWTRVQRTGYPARFTAENVSVGRVSMDSLINGWRHSPPHNANLLSSSARQMGVAMVYRPGTHWKTYWTLVLAAEREPGKLYRERKKSKPAKMIAAKKPDAKTAPAPQAANPPPATAPAPAAAPAPTETAAPAQPANPVQPANPAQPATPAQPAASAPPAQPVVSTTPAQPDAPTASVTPSTPSDSPQSQNNNVTVIAKQRR